MFGPAHIDLIEKLQEDDSPATWRPQAHFDDGYTLSPMVNMEDWIEVDIGFLGLPKAETRESRLERELHHTRARLDEVVRLLAQREVADASSGLTQLIDALGSGGPVEMSFSEEETMALLSSDE